ncbi:uncharacterized protein OCT59_015565 [Rhizophagus irregularis]|uniref:uncharacterized protein n=1 Tax=Rhizophagus irregularis TaxID=588596 RepID=UPI00331961BB|nr:hypothetical protein OCT59_015565 [Rhizophagus irregularis]
MEPTSTKTKKGVDTSRMYYKEYHNFALYANRTQQQIKRWNRLKFSIFKSERSLGQVKPFLINEHSRYLKYQNSLRSRLPPIVDEDKVIETNDNNQVTFFSDKLIMDFHRAHFAPITPTLQQQYPSTPEPDHLRLIKDGDERPIRKARK